MKGDLTLKILTTPDDNLVYTHLVRKTAIELLNSEIETSDKPTREDILAAMMRVAGNSLDDVVREAVLIIESDMSKKRFQTVVTEAYQWKREGLW